MNTLHKTAEFATWLDGLKDRVARAAIAKRLERAEQGNFGDHKDFGDVGELRIDQGPGYRAYYCRIGHSDYLLLCAGDKATQKRDIQRARAMLKHLTEGTP